VDDSRDKVEGLDLQMRSEISEAEGSWKTESRCDGRGVSEEVLRVKFEPRSSWILWIFLIGKC